MSIPADVIHQRLDLGEEHISRKSPEAFLASFDTSNVPAAPGCYIMKDQDDRPIYVGKAKSLRARIRTYINESDTRYSVKFLMRRVAHIDFLITSNEKEALLLENSLIKQYKPRYNVRLKDDKTYISLRLNTKEDFPRLTVVRRYKKDGAHYFGPYHSAQETRQILREIQQLFPLRTCTDHVLRNRTRPCLYYQIKQCVAPCVNYCSREQYHEIVDQVVMVLEGRTKELEQFLLQRIQTLSENLAFEQAAVLRDRLLALQKMMERQRAVAVGGAADRDVFGVYNHGSYTQVQVLFYRGGRMLGGRDYSFTHREMPVEELLSSVLLQYYAAAPAIPSEILVPLDIEDAETLSEVLSEERGAHVTVHWPQRGEKKALVALANRNAERSFEEKRMAAKANADILEQVRQQFSLEKTPERIECFDISTIQGSKTVASMVTFTGGEADKSRYRRYAIRGVAGQDDFASMREALMRRFQRGLEEDDLPDLVVIDGGKGQLNVAATVLKDLGIEDVPHISIAKSRALERGRSPERFFVPGRTNPIIPRQDSPVVKLLAQIRDEAHRFAITYHRQRRGKATLSTKLTSIPGVGPKRARMLLNKLGSVARIRAASPEEIAALPGFNVKLAETIQQHLTTN